MKKELFDYLCNKLKTVLFRQNTHLRKAISVEQRVAITLWCLATTCEYRTIAHLFGIGRSTLCGIVHETCDAIVSLLINWNIYSISYW